MENQNHLLFNRTTISTYLLNHTVVICKQGKRGESGIFSLPETTCKLLQPALRIVIIYNDKRLKKRSAPGPQCSNLNNLVWKIYDRLSQFQAFKTKIFEIFSIINVSPKMLNMGVFRDFTEWNSQFQITVQR